MATAHGACADKAGEVDWVDWVDEVDELGEACLCRLPHKETHMATNLAIDPDLLDRALEVSGERTKKAAVTKALEEFIARRQQKRVLDLLGKLEWDTSYDYKAERSRK